MTRDLSGTPIPKDMEGELRAVFEGYRAHYARVRDLLHGASPGAANHRPQDPKLGRWSIAECIQHLNLTADSYLEVLDRAIDGARAAGVTGRGPFRHGPLGDWFRRKLEPPAGMRFKAPQKVEPEEEPAGFDPVRVLDRFADTRLELFRALENADGLALDRVRVPSPFFPLVRFDLGTAFAVVAAHERRHLWQAERVRHAPDFPAA